MCCLTEFGTCLIGRGQATQRWEWRSHFQKMGGSLHATSPPISQTLVRCLPCPIWALIEQNRPMLVVPTAFCHTGGVQANLFDHITCCAGKPYWEGAGVANVIDLRIAPASQTLQQLLDVSPPPPPPSSRSSPLSHDAVSGCICGTECAEAQLSWLDQMRPDAHASDLALLISRRLGWTTHGRRCHAVLGRTHRRARQALMTPYSLTQTRCFAFISCLAIVMYGTADKGSAINFACMLPSILKQFARYIHSPVISTSCASGLLASCSCAKQLLLPCLRLISCFGK